jgi:hypothetical protein
MHMFLVNLAKETCNPEQDFTQESRQRYSPRLVLDS